MAFGVKTNERPGTRAELRFARFSAYKAREVLNLIRGRSVAEARAILSLTERGAATPVLKLLDSAVANAEHNDSIGADELYVSACFADEGPTLKRFRPRARGRAGRINKRTCHITIIVSRYDAAELERLRERQARSGAAPGASAARARRVAGSRRKSGAAADEVADDVTDDTQISAAAAAEGESPEATEPEAPDATTDDSVDSADSADSADSPDEDEADTSDEGDK